jgi:enoyl-CoA hydratase/carnithine racemase
MNAAKDEPRESLQVRFEGDVAVMTMNNPRRMNALSGEMREAMHASLLELETNRDCRAIVLTGAAGNFCAGGDISEMKQRPILEGRLRFDLLTRIFRMIASGPKPFLAAVEGNCMGAGVSLVAASDYAVASSNARFGCSFVKAGLMPDIGAIWSLPRKVGHRKAVELAFLADPFDGEAALRMNLVNRLCEPSRALEEAIEVAKRFAGNPPMAMALMKAAFNGGSDTLEMAIKTEIDYESVLMNSRDFAEAAAAFIEKRKPNFTGH